MVRTGYAGRTCVTLGGSRPLGMWSGSSPRQGKAGQDLVEPARSNHLEAPWEAHVRRQSGG